MVLTLIIFLAYFIGSIPTAVWLGRYFHGIDVRDHGSHNAGATNTFRILGKRLGWAVLFIDVSKGAFCAILPLFFIEYYTGFKDEELILQLFGGFSAVLGHVFPIYAGFRGGKGVATSLGIVLGINLVGAFVCILIFLIVFMTFRFVSLGAITAAVALPFVSFFWLKEDQQIMIIFTIMLAFVVIVAHRKNIGRLLKGEENKMNLLKKRA
ncbi:MAG: glycerol-3-phosphate 1-O-acyltransferase PlsY [Bacteroidetes bacterium]|nr:glycerol-3-phosphate 1-O-acyltransferase PlsY [Bacteroidota bacterium]